MTEYVRFKILMHTTGRCFDRKKNHFLLRKRFFFFGKNIKSVDIRRFISTKPVIQTCICLFLFFLLFLIMVHLKNCLITIFHHRKDEKLKCLSFFLFDSLLDFLGVGLFIVLCVGGRE